MITFQEEHYSNFFTNEFMELYKIHWKEIGSFDKQKIKLSPDWDKYRMMGKQNNLITYTIRDNEVLIGYNIFIITNHHHYKNTIIAENDILYLKLEYRKGFTGYKFIKYCIKDLKNKVGVIMLSMKASYSFEGMAKRLGFTLMDYKFILEV